MLKKSTGRHQTAGEFLIKFYLNWHLGKLAKLQYLSLNILLHIDYYDLYQIFKNRQINSLEYKYISILDIAKKLGHIIIYLAIPPIPVMAYIISPEIYPHRDIFLF